MKKLTLDSCCLKGFQLGFRKQKQEIQHRISLLFFNVSFMGGVWLSGRTVYHSSPSNSSALLTNALALLLIFQEDDSAYQSSGWG
jgi:hypothetical protein